MLNVEDSAGRHLSLRRLFQLHSDLCSRRVEVLKQTLIDVGQTLFLVVQLLNGVHQVDFFDFGKMAIFATKRRLCLTSGDLSNEPDACRVFRSGTP